jgi:hypothetical protein
MHKYGFVYLLSNPAFPNLYKVGCTERSPTQRADELSSTGVPEPFDVVAYIECQDPQRVELDIHRRLSVWRCNSRREFFNAPVDAIAALMFYHHDAFSWVDRSFYELSHQKVSALPDPYTKAR